MKTLKDIKVGEHAVIEKLHGEGALKRRIMDMGLTLSLIHISSTIRPPCGGSFSTNTFGSAPPTAAVIGRRQTFPRWKRSSPRTCKLIKYI